MGQQNNVNSITLIECDAEIQRVYKARSIRDVSFEIKGRGGTSFAPVINYINNNRQLRDAILIYFTDDTVMTLAVAEALMESEGMSDAEITAKLFEDTLCH